MEILLFGITREIIGKQKLTVPAEDKINNVGELKTWLVEKYPATKKLTSLAIAVDSEYADDNCILDSSAEIALIPPVSGG